jgi:hypothetical protein
MMDYGRIDESVEQLGDGDMHMTDAYEAVAEEITRDPSLPLWIDIIIHLVPLHPTINAMCLLSSFVTVPTAFLCIGGLPGLR